MHRHDDVGEVEVADRPDDAGTAGRLGLERDLARLDDGEHVATVAQEFRVDGMTCGHCQMAVTVELCKLDGVTHVAVDVAAGTVITESVATLPLGAVATAIDEAGYRLV